MPKQSRKRLPPSVTPGEFCTFLDIRLTTTEQNLLQNPPFKHTLPLEKLLDPTPSPRSRRRAKTCYAPRPQNAFILYRRDFVERVARANGKMVLHSISKKASECWNNESIEVRHYFIVLADLCKKRHAERFPGYKYSPRQKRDRYDNNNVVPSQTAHESQFQFISALNNSPSPSLTYESPSSMSLSPNPSEVSSPSLHAVSPGMYVENGPMIYDPNYVNYETLLFCDMGLAPTPDSYSLNDPSYNMVEYMPEFTANQAPNAETWVNDSVNTDGCENIDENDYFIF
ncbi:6342_t:CDS:2 [Paraglomus occultum]|uniref:6342_t:CDS:1 n=1 Tax=Paraglomus occultum TaxID=144539 RepID=A0A9N8ZAJ1_9GLOM|nr:6342_t:CDS:2 [Paraglomus occultum]